MRTGGTVSAALASAALGIVIIARTVSAVQVPTPWKLGGLAHARGDHNTTPLGAAPCAQPVVAAGLRPPS